MNDQARSAETPRELPPIPPAEKPSEALDERLEKLEETTLDKQARSAAFRDVVERKQHLDSLNRRIDVLQGKLDLREADLHAILPKLATLEQSERTSRVLVRDGTVIFVVGGTLVSAGGLFVDGLLKIFLAGTGAAFVVCGIWIAKLLNSNVWPPDQPTTRT